MTIEANAAATPLATTPSTDEQTIARAARERIQRRRFAVRATQLACCCSGSGRWAR